MDLKPYQFDGVAINDTTNFKAALPGDSAMNQTPVNITYSPLAKNAPMYSARVRQPRDVNISIEMQGTTPHAHVDTLNKAFDVRKDEKVFICKDNADSDEQWYLNASVRQPPQVIGRVYKAFLRAAFGIWRSVTLRSDTTWSVTASGQTHAVSPNPKGNAATVPTVTITPTSSKAGGFGYFRYAHIVNPFTIAVNDFLDITDGGIDSAALVSGGKAQADGDDVRVYIDGVETDRYFGTGGDAPWNDTASTVFARIPLSKPISLTLGTAIAGSGAITTIVFANTTANIKAFALLPTAGQLLIANEAFSWTGKTAATLTLTGATRAVLDTSMAAHNAGVTCNWLEHIVTMCYGDTSLAAPAGDTTRKMMWDLGSTNLSHVYTSMSDAAGLRVGRIASQQIVGFRSAGRGTSRLYTGNEDADADPATDLGFYLASWQSGSRWQDDSGEAAFWIYVPQGVTTVTLTGEKLKNFSGGTWLTVTLEASVLGKTWVTIFTEAAPSGTGWEALASHSGVSLGATYYYLRLHVKGAVPAGSGNAQGIELNDITLTLAAKPTITLTGEVANPYPLDCVITNQTTGEYFRVARMIELNQSLQVNLLTRKCTYLKDNTTGPAVGFPDSQDQPMTLSPGVTNTIRYDETGAAGVDVDFSFNDWML